MLSFTKNRDQPRNRQVCLTTPEGTRFLKDLMPFLDAGQAASLRLILIGAGLILLLIYKPQGFFREHRLRVDKGDTK